MALEFKLLIAESLAKQIAEKIRVAILSGDLEINARLPTEQELAQRFKVSRPTIREALKRLAAQNLIRSRRGPTGGSFVCRPSAEELQSSLMAATTLLVSLGEFSLVEVAEARAQLERMCSRVAAERRDQSHLARMAEEIAIQKSGRLTDQEFCASDVRFHRALVDSTGNAIFRFIMFTVIEALQPISNMVITHFRDRGKIVRQHERIYRAICASDPEAAEAAVVAQMRYLRRKYQEAQAWRQRRDETLKDGELKVRPTKPVPQSRTASTPRITRR